MQFFLNGKAADCLDGTTLVELIQQHQLNPKTILIERNGTALHRSEWPMVLVENNDHIEFIRIVAGG